MFTGNRKKKKKQTPSIGSSPVTKTSPQPPAGLKKKKSNAHVVKVQAFGEVGSFGVSQGNKTIIQRMTWNTLLAK